MTRDAALLAYLARRRAEQPETEIDRVFDLICDLAENNPNPIAIADLGAVDPGILAELEEVESIALHPAGEADHAVTMADGRLISHVTLIPDEPEPPFGDPDGMLEWSKSEHAWVRDGEAVADAIDVLNRYFPSPGMQKIMIDAVRGALARAGCDVPTGVYIISEAFRTSKATAPKTLTAQIKKLWKAEGRFAEVAYALGDDSAAQEFYDALDEAQSEAWLWALIQDVDRWRAFLADETQRAFLYLPAYRRTVALDLRHRLADLRDRKMKSTDRREIIRGVILDALLKGEDLAVYADGKTLVLDDKGRPMDRDRGLRSAMGMVAFIAPTQTPWEIIAEIVAPSLSVMSGETIDRAERAYMTSLADRLRHEKAQEREHERLAAILGESDRSPSLYAMLHGRK